MTREQFEKFLDDAAAISDDLDDLVSLGRQLYALALSKLPPHEREHKLHLIEDCGSLRRIVQLFPGPSRWPEVPCGTRH